MKLARILFPTDFSEASAETLERVVALAQRSGARLRIFHTEVLHEHDPVRLERQRAELLGRVDAIRCGLPPEAYPGGEIVFDSARAVSAYDGIMQAVESERPDLIVMATHGGGLLMGSVAERVVRHAPCNVLTCRLHAQGNWPAWSGRILVPVDFSDNSRRALDTARSLADGSPITVVHVVDAPRPPTPYHDVVPLPFDVDPGLRERVEAHVREWAAGPVDAISVVQGNVRETLLDECRRHAAVLVVTGTHGLRPPSEWMIGSTAERLTRSCPCPVLTVR
jgi:nucleotide-binding universal stress UspA family protein